MAIRKRMFVFRRGRDKMMTKCFTGTTKVPRQISFGKTSESLTLSFRITISNLFKVR